MAVNVRIFPQQDTPYPLGRHVAHDDRSRAYGFPVPAVVTRRSVTWTNTDPVLNQLNTNSCVGNAAAQLLNCQIYSHVLQGKQKTWLTETDALAIYSQATHEDGLPQDFYPPNDDGTTALGVAKALQDMGWIDRYLHCFSWQQFLAAIQTQPVMLGTVWTNSMFSPDANGYLSVGPLIDSNVAGGHEFLGRGVDFHSQTVLIRNSWGSGWGINGEALIHFHDMQRLLDAEGDVLVPHVVSTP